MPAPNKTLLDSFLALHPQIKHIQCRLVDYNNTRRAQCITISRALEMTERESDRILSLSSLGPLLHGVDRYHKILPIITEHWEDTEWIPDWSTLKVSSQSPKIATVSVWTRSTYALEKMGDDFGSCPRTILQRLVSRAKDHHGIEFNVGYEIEFTLMEASTANEPIYTGHTFLSPEEIRHPCFRVVKDAIEHLESSGIKIWSYHPEGGSSAQAQYEIALSPCDPLQAADNLVHTMEVIKEQAQKHGFFATCFPTLFEKGPVQGLHFHLSLSPPTTADSFVAGVLDRLPQTTAFLLGGYDSYSQRTKYFGEYAYCGREKNAPLRERGVGHWEFRMPDALSNPYLQLVAVITTGLDGIERGKSMEGRPRSKAEIEHLTEAQRTEAVSLIPRSLSEAVDTLEGDKSWWVDQLGEVCIEEYIDTRRAEIRASEEMSLEERRKVAVLAI